jgi:transcriptional regulator
MYIPSYYRNENLDEVKEFIRANSFAILINEVEGRPWATHIPLLLGNNKQGAEVLAGHISKANKQWKSFTTEKEVLVIFSGAHSYISSSWYDHENVPTWNYEAVHVYGKITLIEGEELRSWMNTLVNTFESGMKHPVDMEKMSQDYVKDHLKGIVGFEITITDVQAVAKLSQNRDAVNLQRITKGLEEKGDADSLAMAKRLKEKYGHGTNL